MRIRLIAVASLGILAACEAPVIIAAAANDGQLSGVTTIDFPAKMLIASQGETDRLYSGTMRGSVAGHADFDVSTADGSNCAGRAEKDGLVRMTCDGARVTYQGAPANRAFSGVRYSDVGGGMQSAFGWGKGADEGLLRTSIAERRDLSPQEVRQGTSD